jgi:hypothetical protein
MSKLDATSTARLLSSGNKYKNLYGSLDILKSIYIFCQVMTGNPPSQLDLSR